MSFFTKPLDCTKALGMENSAITDAQVTASSILDAYHAAFLGRLNRKESGLYIGGWASASCDIHQWLQVDLGSYYIKVTRVATQGSNNENQWVTMYTLQYSDDGVDYPYYVEEGQSVTKV